VFLGKLSDRQNELLFELFVWVGLGNLLLVPERLLLRFQLTELDYQHLVDHFEFLFRDFVIVLAQTILENEAGDLSNITLNMTGY
jgi:hypothetical protein